MATVSSKGQSNRSERLRKEGLAEGERIAAFNNAAKEKYGLPDLVVEFIDSDGNLAGASVMTDPRASFCEVFNESNTGLTARPR